MGNNQSFADIQKKYGQKGIDYVAAKYHERTIYERINDEIVRLIQNTNNQEAEDIEFINQQKRRLQKAFNDAKAEAESTKPGALQQAQARNKLRADDLSGYNQKRMELESLQKQVKNKYATERVRMQERVRQEVRKHQAGGFNLNKIPQYDQYPDNYRRSIESQCIKKYPAKAKQIDATQLERKLTWDNYKQNFITILNRDQVRKQVDAACQNMKDKLVPSIAPVCC